MAVLFWSKLMYEWAQGNAHSAIVVGFTMEVLQTTQGEEYPMLWFPFCIPRRRLEFDMPREAKLQQIQKALQKAKTPGRQEQLRRKLADLEGSEETIVSGEDPPHGNVVILVPPRAEQYIRDRSWPQWDGPITRRFIDVFTSVGYVRR